MKLIKLLLIFLLSFSLFGCQDVDQSLNKEISLNDIPEYTD